jgi:broad specificity phosphatase PhoE
MAMSLTLISHASTRALRRAAFPDDEPLDASAYRKAEAAAPLRRAHRSCTAPELRTRQTAEALGLDAAVETALRDCDYGRWRGSSLAELHAAEPASVASWLAEPHTAPHGGESMLDLLRRVGDWLDGLDAAAGIVAVTHPAIVRAAILHAVGAPASAFWRIDVAPLTQTELRGGKGRWSLRSSGGTIQPLAI